MTVTVNAREPNKMLKSLLVETKAMKPVYHLQRAWNLECWSPKHFPNCLVISAPNFKWPSLILAAIFDFGGHLGFLGRKSFMGKNYLPYTLQWIELHQTIQIHFQHYS